jgi:hypothetical protein
MSQASATTAVPYFSQWETADMTLDVVAEGSAALLRDPLWQASGAETIDDYARWAVNCCGMACLKMLLAARTGTLHPIVPLALACETYGGYVASSDGSIKGLIYAPFVPFVRERFGLEARIVTGITAADIEAILATSGFLIASVHHAIRWPDREPPSKGGHLVLVTAAGNGIIRFHNPSGHDDAARNNVELPLDVFERFFAGRGIVVV